MGIAGCTVDAQGLGRIEFVPAAYTSQRCSHCGHVAPENRESQAVF
ncbi:MAG: zinc ribbon domain-containing protein, partial [Mycobacterium sp.]